MRGKSHLREYFESLIFSVVVVLFIRAFVAEAVQIPTGSMENTLLPGDHLFINKFAFRHYESGASSGLLPFAEVRRRDIVVFKYLDEPDGSKYYVKRVVGLPGECIEIRAKQVYIDQKPLDESYAVFKEPFQKNLRPRDYMDPFEVPPNHFFVMGDNRDRSYDSRFWGALPRDQIIGRPLFVWWSFDPGGGSGLADAVGGFFSRFVGQTRWDRTGKSIY
jgi:signal peptidase I